MEPAPRTTGHAHQPSASDAAALHALRADFPHFRIWREITSGRFRYIARRLSPGSGLHTAVTADLAELRSLLHTARPASPEPTDRRNAPKIT